MAAANVLTLNTFSSTWTTPTTPYFFYAKTSACWRRAASLPLAFRTPVQRWKATPERRKVRRLRPFRVILRGFEREWIRSIFYFVKIIFVRFISTDTHMIRSEERRVGK